MLRNLLVGVLPLLLGFPAHAADRKPSVVVVGVHDPSLDTTAQADAARRMGEVVRASGRFSVMEPDALATAIAGREAIVVEEAFLGPGRRLLEDGRLLYEQAQPEEAVQVLSDAVQALREGVPAAQNVQDLWMAHVVLGTAHLALGNEAAARAAHAEAVALNPSRNPHPARFPPQVLAFYETVRGEQTAAAGTIRITASAADATIHVNGTERGRPPTRLADQPPGEVHVLAQSPDGRRATRVVRIEDGATVDVRLELVPPSFDITDDTPFARARRTASLYTALGTHAQAALLVLAGTEEGALHLQLYSPVSDSFSTPLSLAYSDSPVDEAVAALPELLRSARDDGSIPAPLSAPTTVPIEAGANALLARILLAPKAPVPRAEPPAPATSGRRRWAPAAAGVAAVAFLGTGAAYALSRPQDGRHRGTITIGPLP